MSGASTEKAAEFEQNDIPPCLRCFADDLKKTFTVEGVANTLVLHGLPTFNACVVVLALLSEDGSEFYCPRIEGYPDGVANTWRRFSAEAQMPIAVAVRENRLVLLESLEQRQSFYPPNLQLPPPVGRALAAIPFRHDKMTGAVGFTFPSDRTFVEYDRDLFKAAVTLCAETLARVRQHGLGVEVLVVEDETAVLEMLEYTLKFHAFTVRRASTGDQAIEIYEQHKDTIGVVLLDVQMPCMDGPQTLTALRDIDPHIRCIFMSGNTGTYTAEHLLSLGATRVLSKPFSSLEMLIQELCQLARLQPNRPA
jgi:CheY-like chemotaxis protein